MRRPEIDRELARGLGRKSTRRTCSSDASTARYADSSTPRTLGDRARHTNKKALLKEIVGVVEQGPFIR